MSHFPRYDSYKASGTSLVEEIPAHWQILPFKRILSHNDGGVWNDKTSDNGTRVYRSTEIDIDGKWNDTEPIRLSLTTTEINKSLLQIGDLIVTKSSGSPEHIGKTALVTAIQSGSCYSNFMQRLRLRKGVPRFFFYFLNSHIAREQYKALTTSTSGLGNLNGQVLANLLAIDLPIAEQERIVAFLDEKTAEINEAIAKKRRLIELLQEQKAILINTAVTQGLDPHVPMKESGVEWIGRIPAHWEVSRSKWLFTVRNERARPDDEQLSATQAYGVISQQEYMRKEGRKVTQITQHLEKRRHVEVDDFVISMRSFQGGLERAWATGCIRSSYVVLQPTPQTNPDFFAYLFKSYRYIQALRATSNFIRDGQDLNFNNFALVDLPVIPLEEQKAIASYLDEVIADLANTSEIVQREINLLSEYRICLIAEAVTGKIKI